MSLIFHSRHIYRRLAVEVRIFHHSFLNYISSIYANHGVLTGIHSSFMPGFGTFRALLALA